MTEHVFRCFTVTKMVKGVERHYHFTSHSSPLTVDGVQYVPLSLFDQEAWNLVTAKDFS